MTELQRQPGVLAVLVLDSDHLLHSSVSDEQTSRYLRALLPFTRLVPDGALVSLRSRRREFVVQRTGTRAAVAVLAAQAAE